MQFELKKKKKIVVPVVQIATRTLEYPGLQMSLPVN